MRRSIVQLQLLNKTLIHSCGGRRSYFKDAKYTSELKPLLGPKDPIPIFQIMNGEGKVTNGALEPKIDKEVAIKMMKTMITLNVMDQILYDAQRQGRISFYMTNTGEEATHIGSAAALTLEDTIFGQYREVGVLLWRGYGIEEVLNQCYSNHLDPGKGRQMPVHYGSAKLNFQTISSPLGTQIPQATGAAYAMKILNRNSIVMCYFGEGAASEGDFHAGLNIAATKEAPVIFFCRNNHYAISTKLEDQYRGDGIASRGPGYGIPTFRVDGNDVLAVMAVTAEARKICIEQSRPVLIEAITYRVGHHSTSDDSSAYRGRDEINLWSQGNNPVLRFKRYIEGKGWWSEGKDKECRDAIRSDFLKEFAAAEARKKPPIEYMFSDVYNEMPWHLKEQLEELKNHLKEYGQHYPIDLHVEPPSNNK